MPYFVMDRSTWPVVEVKFIDDATDDEFNRYLSALESLYEQDEPFGLLFDARDANYLPGKYRRRQAEWIADNETMIRDQLTGTAYVITSSILRGILRTIFSIQKQPVPYTVVGTMDEARDWLADRLDR